MAANESNYNGPVNGTLESEARSLKVSSTSNSVMRTYLFPSTLSLLKSEFEVIQKQATEALIDFHLLHLQQAAECSLHCGSSLFRDER